MKIVLIGMPGSGKSHIGKRLAERLNFGFLDDDKILEERYGLDTTKLLEKVGDEKFLLLEEEIFLENLKVEKVVVSPGGSIVYSTSAMEYAFENAKIIYLNTSLEIVKVRIEKEPRGIVNMKNKSIDELFWERENLYEKYSHFKIDTFGKGEGEILEEISKFLSR